MFEKEAEKKYCKGCKLRIEQCLWAWRNTNGLNEPNEKNCSCIKVPAYIAGAEFGYNKANEWHKADEKPKVTKEYLVYLISGYNCRSVTMMIYNAERGFWCADNQNDVVYWKEIVLPKESE